MSHLLFSKIQLFLAIKEFLPLMAEDSTRGHLTDIPHSIWDSIITDQTTLHIAQPDNIHYYRAFCIFCSVRFERIFLLQHLLGSGALTNSSTYVWDAYGMCRSSGCLNSPNDRILSLLHCCTFYCTTSICCLIRCTHFSKNTNTYTVVGRVVAWWCVMLPVVGHICYSPECLWVC